MKIACIADTHLQHDELVISPSDILIHAGDFLRTGKEKEVKDFFNWFSITYLAIFTNHMVYLKMNIPFL